jgi:adenylate cyclase class 2
VSAGPVGLETEIKIPVASLPGVRARALSAGAAAGSPRHEERNVLFDDEAGSLRERGCALRLREARGRAILTFKGAASFSGKVKTREEIETDVSSADAVTRVLEALGLRPRFRYEKFREELTLGDCVVALDETPIGSFVEVEGPSVRIPSVLASLGLDAADAVAGSYAGLYRRERERDPRLPPDMVFPR